MKDYYKILEIEKESEKEDIKKAYRKMALKYHPDKNNGDDDKFKDIAEAYEILSDDNKRIQYDYNCSHGVNYSTFGHDFMNPNDLFKQLFHNSDIDIISNLFNVGERINPNTGFNTGFNTIISEFLSSNNSINSSKSISSSTIIQNGKKIVRTTVVENGVSKTEEKIYDFQNNFISNS